MKTSEKIKSARKRKGLTQKQLAEIVGAATATINKIEADDTKDTSIKNASFNLAVKIAAALECNVFELFGDETLKNEPLNVSGNELDHIKSLETEIRILGKNIDTQGQVIENLSNEKEYIKIFLVIQVVRNAISHLGQLDNLIELATDENLIERLKGHRKSALILYKFSKEQFIKVGFLKQVDFDNYLNDNTDQSPIIEELKNI
jgi:DNA-binding XRE family transcriptional regulator